MLHYYNVAKDCCIFIYIRQYTLRNYILIYNKNLSHYAHLYSWSTLARLLFFLNFLHSIYFRNGPSTPKLKYHYGISIFWMKFFFRHFIGSDVLRWVFVVSNKPGKMLSECSLRVMVLMDHEFNELSIRIQSLCTHTRFIFASCY